MKLGTWLLVAAGVLMANAAEAAPKWALAIHGGAGVIDRNALSPEQEKAYREAMARAAEAGARVLRAGGSSLDAVEAAVVELEDDPLFNAGRGAVFTAEGKNELDAAVMEGRDLKAGAVAGVTRTRNPIRLAREVMQSSPHVMLIGPGAEEFARSRGLPEVDPAYFYTSQRWRALERELARQNLPVPAKPPGARDDDRAAALAHDEGKRGTVGAVAVDIRGDVAAATSTGGTTAKRWGRVGDAPIIGAGTYADNASCAVSATGTGEYFIRLTVAREVCALVEHNGLSLQAAADEVIQRKLTKIGGDGGVIAVSPAGEVAWSFNTSGMYRASIADGRPLVVGVYKDDP
ncbi:MAG: isoaspartyl peptidase/L-asparaginase [Phenylobacterium sp.]|jgi:beta-aspartyl-peptidase (threonine type)|uniref:isoaspartyl peptidase/L-asparaginase family protein n=1 Tax=Phenylobacterium sp. TaxID=1871053 RepID=UPI002A35B832|nr:isoaspartyl peptidase/L-asparaginase [Phenylobacterium sp.]MDX9997254.1 isoaspartyl peptidase/L-asparaginase [Phenylobacterium sp.]